MAEAAQIKIFFGSQSGTAECFAEELRDEAVNEGLDAEVVDLQTFTPESFVAVKIAVLVVSTYGEGEPSDNAVTFHKWATDPRNDGALPGQRFCVMGLGDMNYARFNNMGLECDQSLERLGGKRIYQRGVGDDSQDIGADFANWKGGGLWARLKQAVADVQQELTVGGSDVLVHLPGQALATVPVVTAPPKLEIGVFFGHEDDDGAAKDICEQLTEQLRQHNLSVTLEQSLSDRKAVEAVRKLPKRSVAVLVVDCGPDGLCSAGRKLVRNMNLELDSQALADKELRFAFLAVATSKCNNSACSLKDQIQQGATAIPKAFDRVGVKCLEEKTPAYVDAGVEDVSSFVNEMCNGLGRAAEAVAAAVHAPPSKAACESAPDTQKKTYILYTGDEAQEAGEALIVSWPGGSASTAEAALGSLGCAVGENAQVVLAIECMASGDLSDKARGLIVQLGAAPIAIKQQLRKLRFATLVIAATDYGNAGERASARGTLTELAKAAAPVTQALAKLGACCVASASVDLQDTDPTKLAGICNTFQQGFTTQAARTTSTSGTVTSTTTATASTATMGTASLRMGASMSDLPAEAPGEGADVLSRFFFEADKAKVLKVRELRQSPKVAEGLATAEVEIEAVGGLKSYTLGGTLSVVPENDPADIAAVVSLLGLSEGDLSKFITFVAAEGPGIKVKKPFPTPCTLREALACYCDLGRAPTKKMLTAMQPKLKDQDARDRVGKLLENAEAVKSLSAAPQCCRMHEFWSMLGITHVDASGFLLHCPRQKAREFTIASSPTASPERISLCVSLTSHTLPSLSHFVEQLKACGCLPKDGPLPSESRGRFFGMGSNWITTRIKAGNSMLAKFRPSAFHLPERDVPVIMIGSGAGVAPFRGFWDELRRGPQTAPVALFFGCRHQDEDWLFKEEMNAAVKRQAAAGCAALARVQAAGPKKPLTCLFTAFSRPGEGKEKMYVQDHLRHQATSVKHWVQKMSGFVFVCGSTAMGNGVLEALAEILDGGKDAVDTLRKDGRIVAEMWG